MNLSLDQLDLLGTATIDGAGKPLRLALDAIDEDPQQPRLEFEPDALAELAASIAERGVLQPVSVRRHPDRPEHWILNFGARRLRASRMAGKGDIPAFIDDAADSYDQVIENEQRDGLKPIELALFVQRRLLAGDIQAEIARRLGKSRQYVTFATALIDPPDWLLAAYRSGRCRGLNELHALRSLASIDQERVEQWAVECEDITRSRLASLRAELASRSMAAPRDDTAEASMSGVRASSSSADDRPAADRHRGDMLTPPNAPTAPRRASRELALVARCGDREVIVDTGAVPSEPGHLFVRSFKAGPMFAVEAASLKLLGLVTSDELSNGLTVGAVDRE